MIKMCADSLDKIKLREAVALYKREGWGGAIDKDQVCLEWLHHQGATSFENSQVSILEYQEKIMEVFNVKVRQAKNICSNHKERGWIDSKFTPKDSKVWLLLDIRGSVISVSNVTITQFYHSICEIIENTSLGCITYTPCITDSIKGDFRFVWNDYEIARWRSEGAWYCNKCNKPVKTENERIYCSTCNTSLKI